MNNFFELFPAAGIDAASHRSAHARPAINYGGQWQLEIKGRKISG